MKTNKMLYGALVISWVVLLLFVGIASVNQDAALAKGADGIVNNNVIILPINQQVGAVCMGGDELRVTFWSPGEIMLECREYLNVAETGTSSEGR